MTCSAVQNFFLCMTGWDDVPLIEAWGAMGVAVGLLAWLLVALRRFRLTL